MQSASKGLEQCSNLQTEKDGEIEVQGFSSYTIKKNPFYIFNLPGPQKPGRNFPKKNSCCVIKDLGILDSQNNLWTNS